MPEDLQPNEQSVAEENFATPVDGAGDDLERMEQAEVADGGKVVKKDLTADPNFREWQSKYDKRLAEQQKAYQEAMAALEAERQARLAKEREAREAKLAQMDDYERAIFERDEALATAQEYARYLEEQRQQFEMYQAEQYKRQRLEQISREYGVPVTELDDSSPTAALESAVRYLARRGNRANNAVDVGGGGASTPASRYKQEYEKALKNNDAIALLRVKWQAAAEGIELE